MNTVNVSQQLYYELGHKKHADRLRQALARRRVQDMHDEKALRNWLTEVWDASP